MSLDKLVNIFERADNSRNAVRELMRKGFRRQSALALAFMYQEMSEEGGAEDSVRARFGEELKSVIVNHPLLEREIVSL